MTGWNDGPQSASSHRPPQAPAAVPGRLGTGATTDLRSYADGVRDACREMREGGRRLQQLRLSAEAAGIVAAALDRAAEQIESRLLPGA